MKTRIDFVVEDATARCLGDWIAPNLHQIERRLSGLDMPGSEIQFDLGGIESLDTERSEISKLAANRAGGTFGSKAPTKMRSGLCNWLGTRARGRTILPDPICQA